MKLDLKCLLGRTAIMVGAFLPATRPLAQTSMAANFSPGSQLLRNLCTRIALPWKKVARGVAVVAAVVQPSRGCLVWTHPPVPFLPPLTYRPLLPLRATLSRYRLFALLPKPSPNPPFRPW